MDFNEERKKIGNRLIVLTVALIVIPSVAIALAGLTVGLFTAVPIAIGMLVHMWLRHSVNVREDEARGFCKGWNRVSSVQTSGLLLGLTGLLLVSYRWESLSIVDPLSWLWVLFASFFVLRGVICHHAGNEYERTIVRIEQLESQVRVLQYKLDRRPPTREQSGDGI